MLRSRAQCEFGETGKDSVGLPPKKREKRNKMQGLYLTLKISYLASLGLTLAFGSTTNGCRSDESIVGLRCNSSLRSGKGIYCTWNVGSIADTIGENFTAMVTFPSIFNKTVVFQCPEIKPGICHLANHNCFLTPHVYASIHLQGENNSCLEDFHYLYIPEDESIKVRCMSSTVTDIFCQWNVSGRALGSHPVESLHPEMTLKINRKSFAMKCIPDGNSCTVHNDQCIWSIMGIRARLVLYSNSDDCFSKSSMLKTRDILVLNPPTEANITFRDEHSVNISWGFPEGLCLYNSRNLPVEYAVRYTPVGGSAWTTWEGPHLPRSEESYIDGLMPFMEYNLQVSAEVLLYPVGPWSKNFTFMTTEAAPRSPVKSLLVTDLDSTNSTRTINISWQPVPVQDQLGIIREYEVNINSYFPLCRNESIHVSSEKLSIVKGGLHFGCSYTISVCAWNGAGSSGFVHTTIGPIIKPPSRPQNFILEVISPTEVRAQWDDPSIPYGHITGYNLTWLETESQESFTVHNITVGNGRRYSFSISHLKPFHVYTINLWAKNEFLWSSPVTAEAQTSEDVPARAPVDVEIKREMSALRVTWRKIPAQFENGIIKNYTVYFCPENSCLSSRQQQYLVILEERGQEKMHMTLDNLQPGTVYLVNVSASTLAGEGPRSRLSRVKTFREPVMVKDLKLQFVKRRSAEINWTTSIGSCFDGSLLFKVLHHPTTSDEHVLRNLSSCSAELDGLLPEADYILKVQSCYRDDLFDCGPWSNMTFSTEGSLFVLPQLIGLEVVQVTEKSVQLSWFLNEKRIFLSPRYSISVNDKEVSYTNDTKSEVQVQCREEGILESFNFGVYAFFTHKDGTLLKGEIVRTNCSLCELVETVRGVSTLLLVSSPILCMCLCLLFCGRLCFLRRKNKVIIKFSASIYQSEKTLRCAELHKECEVFDTLKTKEEISSEQDSLNSTQEPVNTSSAVV